MRFYGIIILFHSGHDFAFDEENVHSNPKRFLDVIKKFPDLKVILAHLGGYRMWDLVYKILINKNIFFDTSFTTEIDDNVMRNIILNHGPEKILYGSDFPWQRQKKIIEKLRKIIDNKIHLNMIFFENAKKLLGL